MNNCKQLRASLADVFQDLRDGKITAEDASELANLAGKMINSAKVQVAYYELTKSTPSIEFLNEETSSK